MKNYLLLFILIIPAFAAGFFIGQKTKKEFKPFTEDIIQKIDKPLEKYSFDNLSQTNFKPGKLKITDKLKEEKEYSSYVFEYEFNPNLDGKTLKKTTGQLNIPSGQAAWDTGGQNFKNPIILMFRGFVNQEIYKTGDGTRNAAAFFAKNGFLTISPDFLGYSGSDKEADNIFESRFQTYVTALSILRYLENNKVIKSEYGNWEFNNLFIWGHSNGGQVAITLLELSGANHPTVLWAPVTKPFPYSVLYYTDESEDRGKYLRKELSKFEDNYDVDKYSLTNYLEKITAPVLLQQGEDDDAVPLPWSRDVVSKLKKLDKKVTLITYPGTDHNMRPSWDEAVNKDINFFDSYIE